MRIGIDGVALQSPSYQAGLYQYTHRLVHGLSEAGGSHSYSLLFFNWRSQTIEETIHRYSVAANVQKRLCRVPFRLLSALDACSFPVDRFVGRFDVFHGPTFRLPPGRYAKRSMVTVHDLKFLDPDLYSPGDRAGAEQFRRHTVDALERADVVVAVSCFTQNDLAERLNCPKERIRVIYPGIGDEFHPDQQVDSIRETATRYGLRAPYVLFVGFHEEKKNLLRLLDAFALLQGRVSEPHQLVLAGPFGPVTPALRRRIAELRMGNAVCLPGVITASDLPAVYAGARAFAFPSLHEGFGIPPLEAMACGVPVIASKAAALPEIVGPAALLVDPAETDSIADGLSIVLTDATRRTAMREAGLRHAQRFSWRKMARETMALYQELA
ncbi:MAG: glycosyltransferase family 4 protein [Nitrospiraceae bacterium]|nr:glycosyltransferase family 4 protein [Nitrospiraceae bacterium]